MHAAKWGRETRFPKFHPAVRSSEREYTDVMTNAFLANRTGVGALLSGSSVITLATEQVTAASEDNRVGGSLVDQDEGRRARVFHDLLEFMDPQCSARNWRSRY